MARWFSVPSLWLGLGFVASLQGLAFPQSIKLNGPLAQPLPGGPIRGDVDAFHEAARTGLVVYRADEDVDEVFDLYSARLDTRGPSHRLTAALSSTGSVTSEIALSPDGERVVFTHRAPGFDQSRIYTVTTRGGGAPVLVDGPGIFTSPLAFSAGNERVVFRKLQDGYPTLCSAPTDGSAPAVTLYPSEPPTPLEGWVEDFQISPDGTRVLFRAHPGITGDTALYVVPVDGSSASRRLSTHEGASHVYDYLIAPDGQNVVYLERDLFSASIDGERRPKRLNDPLPDQGSVQEFLITSDSRTVVFIADQGRSKRFRLFSAHIDGRHPPHGALDGTRRTDPMLLTPMVGSRSLLPGFVLTADGTHALYRADAITRFLPELFSVPTDGGGAPLVLNPSPPPAGIVSYFALAPDQQHVVYDAVSSQGHELVRVPLAGGPALVLHASPITPEFFQISPDSAHVVFLAQDIQNGVRELFSVPLDASAHARRLNRPLPQFRSVLYDFVPLSGGRALYRADQEAADVLELYEGFFEYALPAR